MNYTDYKPKIYYKLTRVYMYYHTALLINTPSPSLMAVNGVPSSALRRISFIATNCPLMLLIPRYTVAYDPSPRGSSLWYVSRRPNGDDTWNIKLQLNYT